MTEATKKTTVADDLSNWADGIGTLEAQERALKIIKDHPETKGNQKPVYKKQALASAIRSLGSEESDKSTS